MLNPDGSLKIDDNSFFKPPIVKPQLQNSYRAGFKVNEQNVPNLKSFLKQVGKIGAVAINVGDVLGLPGLTQLDTVLDIVNNSKAEDHDKKAVAEFVNAVKEQPIIAVSDSADTDRIPFWESKRFLMTLFTMVSVIIMYKILPKESADTLFPWLTGLAGVYVAGDTIRPSSKT